MLVHFVSAENNLGCGNKEPVEITWVWSGWRVGVVVGGRDSPLSLGKEGQRPALTCSHYYPSHLSSISNSKCQE